MTFDFFFCSILGHQTARRQHYFSELTVNKSEPYVLQFHILKMTLVIPNGVGKVTH